MGIKKILPRVLVVLVLLGGLAFTYQNCGPSQSPFNFGNNALGSKGTINNTVQITGSISAGASYTCGINAAGQVRCWGLGTSGQLGQGSYATSTSAVAVSPALPAAAVKVVAGLTTSCALLTNHTVYCWGDNTHGEVGNPSASVNFPVAGPIQATLLGNNLYDVAVSAYTTCAVNQTGIVICVGSGTDGELGTGASSADASAAAVTIPSITNAVRIAGNNEHFCATLSTGAVVCWGANFIIGNGNSAAGPIGPTTASEVLPAGKVVTNQNATNSDTCALMASGAPMECWGDNTYGQLGRGTTTQNGGAVQAITFTTYNFIDIALSEYTACGINSSQGVDCWGQWGMGATTESYISPVGVGLSNKAVAISGGLYHMCAMLSGQTAVQCWGDNLDGDLGNTQGTATPVASPASAVSVVGFYP